MRKPAFCICKADQRLCFRYMHSTIHLLPKFEMSSLQPSSVAVQLRNKFNFWSVHGIMNPLGLVQSKRRLTLQETGWVHDSMNRPKINLLLIFTFLHFS